MVALWVEWTVLSMVASKENYAVVEKVILKDESSVIEEVVSKVFFSAELLVYCAVARMVVSLVVSMAVGLDDCMGICLAAWLEVLLV